MTVSIKWKIALTMWILAAFCSIASGVVSAWLLVKNHEKSMDQQLKNTAATLMSLGITDYSGLQGFQKLDAFIQGTLRIKKVDVIISVYTKRGKLMFSSVATGDEEFRPPFSPISRPAFSAYEGESRKYKVLTTPYVAKNGKDYFLQLAMTYPLYSEIISSTLWQAVLLFFVLSLVALLIAHMLARRLVSPVRLIAGYLNNLDPADIKNWRPLIMTRAGVYLSDIVAGVNSLILRVKSTIYSLSRTSRYLAHELRNPLTILIGESEGVLSRNDATIEDYKVVLKSSLEEVDRMNNVVSAVLRIVKKEKLSYRPIPCNVGRLIDDNVEKWKAIFEGKIQWEKPEYDVIRVLDADLLLQLIDNLMRNVHEHTRSKECRIAIGEEGEDIVIIIEDFGWGMDRELINALNNGDLMSDKLGIGLMLCLEICSICNFNISFKNKELGGLLVHVRL